MTVGAPPRTATKEYLDELERVRRLTGLRVNTLTMAVTDLDDTVGWARLTELGTSATMEAQRSGVLAAKGYAEATLAAAGVPGSVNVPVRPGVLASGRDVRPVFAATADVVGARVAGGATFPEGLQASAKWLAGTASSEVHRVGRDGLLAAGLSDDRFERFRRVMELGACPFCRMLATRGAVYLSAARAGEARRYHNHCRCHIELVVGRDAIDASQGLQGDWRNAIRDDDRLTNAGVVRLPDRDVVTAIEEVAVDAGGWVPGKWEAVDPAELIPPEPELPEHLRAAAARQKALEDLLRLGPRSRRKPQKPVAHALRNGNKTVMSTQKLTQTQLRGLLDDFDEAIAAVPSELRANPIGLDIPVGDPKWKGRTGGYVIAGSPKVHLKPAIAKGAELWDESEFHMPAATRPRTRRDVIMHEMGHVVDAMRNTTGILRDRAPLYGEQNFWAGHMDKMPTRAYSRQSVHEGFAEMFMQYHVGGPGSHPVADAYAARYGW